MAEQTLEQRLVEAQREAQGWREKLCDAEQALNAALEVKDYAAAEKHKAAADAARQPLLIAEATVHGVQAGLQALAQHQQAENLARQRRERIEQGTAQHDAARTREAEALEDMQRYMSEVPVAYEALYAAMQAAMQAEQRAGTAVWDAHEAAKAAEIVPQDMPRPTRPNAASARYESHPVLIQVLRNPRLS